MKVSAFFVALLLATPAFAQAGDPQAAANSFYAVYGAQHRGGIPDATQRLRYSGVLTPSLNKQLADAASTQDRLTARMKGQSAKNAVPPMLEGDIFSSLFEGATAWKVGTCTADGKTARCPVALTHIDQPQNPSQPSKPPAKPANWNDTLLLANTPQGWKVDDVLYDAGFAFGNTGRLSDMLKMVVASNP